MGYPITNSEISLPIQMTFLLMELLIIVSTIDGSQGDQHAYCILDLRFHGERRYPIGFIKDVKRMKVVLCRAKNGMVLVGYKGMTDGQ